MYYPDLSPARVGVPEQIATVFPDIINIGWLDAKHEFTNGEVPLGLIQKLKELMFIDQKIREDKENEIFERSKAILIEHMIVRGPPATCPFCCREKPATFEPELEWLSDYGLEGQPQILRPENLRLYKGKKNLLLGIGELNIPSADRTKLYNVPTMIIHYIEKHNYRPPEEFLKALEAFPLDMPYDPSPFYKTMTTYKTLYENVDAPFLRGG
jgi:hypothetical protein